MKTWVPSTANEVKRNLSLSLNVKSSSDITSLTPPPDVTDVVQSPEKFILIQQ